MSAHKFLVYAPALTVGQSQVLLTGDEHHHTTRVLRRRVGDQLHVTNGAGLIVAAIISHMSDTEMQLDLGDTLISETPAPPVTIALATIKKDRWLRALEQCVELGVTRMIPFVSENSSTTSYPDNFTERAARICVSAMKQSFRAWLPRVDAPLTFEMMLGAVSSDADLLVGGQGGNPPAEHAGERFVVVGPEAGMSQNEEATLSDRGAALVSVSRFRLRAETAAAALAARLAPRVD